MRNFLSNAPSTGAWSSQSSTTSLSSSNENINFRILMKGSRDYQASNGKEKENATTEKNNLSYNDDDLNVSPQVVATSNDIKLIKEEWNWITENVLLACSFFNNKDTTELKEMYQFLMVKFTTLAEENTKKYEKEREREREREREIEIVSHVDHRNSNPRMKKIVELKLSDDEADDTKKITLEYLEMDRAAQGLWKKAFSKLATTERVCAGSLHSSDSLTTTLVPICCNDRILFLLSIPLPPKPRSPH